jgi:CpeT protein
MRPALTFIASLLLLTSSGRAEPSALDHLYVFLTGSFSSADQARGDQNFRAASLHVTPIWTDRTDGPWLYLEQALSDAPAHPYRQLVYQLGLYGDETLAVRIFELPDLLAATGAWKDPARLAHLTPANLVQREGCTLVLRLQAGGTFKGETEGRGCASSLRGASYSMVETVISNLQIITWERGFNSAGAQVWGSIHGGAVFKRVE